MIISRQLRVALLVSFLWHLLGISFVSVVFSSGGFKSKQPPSVCFLGSILRDPAAGEEIRACKRPLLEFPVEAQICHFDERQLISLPDKRQMLDPDSFIDMDVHTESQASAASFVSKDTFPAEREMIFRPPFVKYPEVLMRQQVKSEWAVFKIYISTDGLVEQVVNMQASSSPEVDAALARYIERWRFAPAAGIQGQWQTVKINLDFNGSTALTINPE